MTPDKVTLLSDVAVAAAAFEAARQSLERAVERARGAGASWSEVGQALGMTRQGAFRRFNSVGAGRDKPQGRKDGRRRSPTAPE